MDIEKRLDEILRETLLLDDDVVITGDMAPGKTDNWNSLQNMELISRIEEEFQIEFEFDELMEFDNWAKIKQVVLEKKGV